MPVFFRLIVALRKPVVMAVKKPTPLTYIGAGGCARRRSCCGRPAATGCW